MSSTVLILSRTCWMSPTSVLVCRLRTLLRRMAVNMLQISAWHVTSQWDSSSTMQPMLSASWMMKFISRSNSPPTSWGRRNEDQNKGRWMGCDEVNRRRRREERGRFSKVFNLLSVGEVSLSCDGCWLWLGKHFFCWGPHMLRQITIPHPRTYTNLLPVSSAGLSNVSRAALSCENYYSPNTAGQKKWPPLLPPVHTDCTDAHRHRLARLLSHGKVRGYFTFKIDCKCFVS